MAKKKKKNRDGIPFDREKDTGVQRPVRARIAAGDVGDKYSDYPSNGLTQAKLARIFREADEGNVRMQMELFEDMEEKDTHLFAQMQTRKLAVTGLDWEVRPFSPDEADKEIADFVREQLQSITNFDEVLIDMLDAIGKGISIMELAWEAEDGKNVIEDIEYVHPKKLVWDGEADEMKICTKEFPSGISLPENKFVVHRYKAKSGHVSRAGLFRVTAWMYLFKNYDIKDWVSFCEVYGMPLRLGKYDASASEDDKRQLMEAIVRLGTDAAGIVPSSTMIEFIEANKTTSVDLYENFARFADEQISKAVLGQTLTSDSGGGSYAQSKTHNEVRHDLTAADAKALAVTIRRDIIRPLVEFNFGFDVNIPFFEFDCREVEDQKEAVEVLKTLACDMGLQIPTSYIYRKFNIPEPEENEDVLQPQFYSGADTGQADPVESEELKLTQDAESKEQAQIDTIVGISNKQAEDIFREMMKPLFRLIDDAADMKELQKALKDGDTLRRLYQEMENPELEELLQQGMYLSRLIGRTMD